MRHTTKLPETNELKEIIAFEAKRRVPKEKLTTHYPNFSVFTNLLDVLRIDSTIITQEVSEETWLAQKFQERSLALIESVLARILADTECVYRAYYDAVYDYLSEEDAIEKADGIFVFGAKTPLRVKKAIQLYNERWSKQIIFSGHGTYTGRENASEAETYKHLAIEAGIPRDDILIETRSITVPDNVRSSLNLFDEIGFKPQSLILVNSPYVQRRGWALFRKYVPDSIRLIRQNCATGAKFSRDNWFTNSDGINVILNEFIKMKIAVTLNTA